jgi:hypothetical protein
MVILILPSEILSLSSRVNAFFIILESDAEPSHPAST